MKGMDLEKDYYIVVKCIGCPCGDCDGHCGPDNGCPCPDCDYTLSYILYFTGKMKCEICKKTLIRINIFNLRNILKSNIYYMGNDFTCDSCYKDYTGILFIPLMVCKKCNYKLCPKCAFSKITVFEQKIPYIDISSNYYFRYATTATKSALGPLSRPMPITKRQAMRNERTARRNPLYTGICHTPARTQHPRLTVFPALQLHEDKGNTRNKR